MRVSAGKLTTQAGAVAISRIAATAASLGTNIVLAWMLGKDSNGVLQKAFVVTQIAILAGAFGIQASLFYFLPRTPNGQKRALTTQSAAILTAIGFLLAIAIFASASTLAILFKLPELALLLKYGAVAVLITLPAMIAEPVLIAESRAWTAAIMAVLAAAVQVIFTAIVLTFWKRIELVFVAIAVSQLVRLLIGGGFAFAQLPAADGSWPGKAMVISQISYVLPIGITSIIDALSVWLDRALVSFFYTEEQLATYTYGAVEVPFIGILIGAITPVLLPQFSRMLKENRTHEVLDLWHRASLKTGLVLFALFSLLMWVAPQFLSTIYSQKYRDSAVYFRIYLALLPLRIVSYMPLLYALGRNRYVMIGAAGDLILNLIVSLLLMRVIGFGMAGAALGTIAATMMQVLFYMTGIRRWLNTTWARVLPWRGLLADFTRPAIFFSILPGSLVMLRAPDITIIAASIVAAITYGWFWILPRVAKVE